MEIENVASMKKEWFEAIAEQKKLPEYERTRYMVGVKLVDGRDCDFHEVYYIDCDIATGDMIGWIERDDIIIERIPRKMVLRRV